MTGRGVPGSGGVDIGKVQLMLKARPLQGMRVNPVTGAKRKVHTRYITHVTCLYIYMSESVFVV